MSPLANAVAVALAILPMSVLAAPTGGKVVAGQASIAHNVSPHGTTTTINQASQNAAINWQRFSSQAGEHIQFNQPNATAIALNRVVGNEASVLNGSLTANGQVFIVNPNGVLTGKNATFNTAGLVLSTGDINNADFMHGNYQFTDAKGSIHHQGSIEGGYVAMIAPKVTNTGNIHANGARVELAAADTVTLNINNGSLAGLTIDKGTLNAMIDNGGAIRSDGGIIHLTAKGYDQASKAVVNHSGIIEANTTATNAKGEIILLADMQSGTTTVSGTLNAKGEHNNTDGGFIETSGATVKIADTANISTKANNGKTGKWLLDPYDFTIAASGGDITGSALSAALGTNHVTLQTTDTAVSCTGATCGTGDASGNGDIHVNDTVNWSANTLTLDAHRNININSSLNATGTAGLALKYGQSSTNGGTSNYHVNAPVNLASTASFTTQKGSTGATKTYTIITSLGSGHNDTSGSTLQGINGNLAGNYVLGTNIDASSTSSWDNGKGFQPIGAFYSGSWTVQFSGNLDGLGHTINNLTINRTQDYVGLFGVTTGTSDIRNVGVSGGSITGGAFTAGLVGINHGKISNSFTNIAVTGNQWVGGLVAYNRKYDPSDLAVISQSYASGDVTGIGTHATVNFFGGLVGDSSTGAIIKQSYATGNVSTNTTNQYKIGGLSGRRAGIIQQSYWDTLATGQSNSCGDGSCGVGATGLDTTQMQTASSFTGWDIDTTGGQNTTWRMYEGKTAPLLKAFMVKANAKADQTVTYNGNNQTINDYTLTDDSGNALNKTKVYGPATYTGTGKNAGSYTATVSGLHSQQQGYDLVFHAGQLTIDKANLTLSGSRTYDGTTKTAGTTLTATGVNGETFSMTGAGDTSNLSSKNASATAQTLASVTGLALGSSSNGGLISNYNALSTAGSQYSITKKALTATAKDASKTYDGTAYSGGNGVTYNGFVSGENASVLGGTLVYGGMAQGAVDVGNYTLTAGGQTAANYQLSYQPGILTIVAKPVDPDQNNPKLPNIPLDTDCYRQPITGKKVMACNPVFGVPKINIKRLSASLD